jgi:hypothetical protein
MRHHSSLLNFSAAEARSDLEIRRSTDALTFVEAKTKGNKPRCAFQEERRVEMAADLKKRRNTSIG